MEKFLEQLKKLHEVHMDAEAKSRVRLELVRFMTANPAVDKAPFWTAVSVQRFFAPVGIAALLLFTGGTASFAAEAALPGEPLYAVKTRFNEPMIGALSASDMKKAAWEVRVAERRLEEADTLAMAGKLDATAQAHIETNFEFFAKSAEEKIAALSSKGEAAAATEISAKFESSLKAHADILAKLDGPSVGADPASNTGIGIMAMRVAEEKTAETPNAKLRTKINAVLGSLARARGENEGRVNRGESPSESAVAAEGKLRAAKSAVLAAEKLLAVQKPHLDAQAVIAAEARLAGAKASVADAAMSLEAENYADAFSFATHAIRAAQEMRVLARAQVEQSKLAAGTAASPEADARKTAAVNFLEIPRGAEEEYATLGIGVGAAATLNATSSVEEASSSESGSSTTTIKLNVDDGLRTE